MFRELIQRHFHREIAQDITTHCDGSRGYKTGLPSCEAHMDEIALSLGGLFLEVDAPQTRINELILSKKCRR